MVPINTAEIGRKQLSSNESHGGTSVTPITDGSLFGDPALDLFGATGVLSQIVSNTRSILL